MAYYFLMSPADQVVHPLPPLHPKTNKQKAFFTQKLSGVSHKTQEPALNRNMTAFVCL